MGSTNKTFVVGNSSPSEQDNAVETCVVCLEDKVGVRLQPCGHAIMCTACIRQLQDATCPMCRKEISAVQHLEKERETQSMQEIQESRRLEDYKVRQAVLQVLFVGAINSGKKFVQETLLELFPPSADRPGSSKRTSTMCGFEGNCEIHGDDMRLSVLEGPGVNEENPFET